MKNFTIIYRNDNKTLTDQTRQGRTKSEMKELFKMNGYTVIAVLTDSDIESIKAENADKVEREYQLKKYHPATWWKYYVQQVL